MATTGISVLAPRSGWRWWKVSASLLGLLVLAALGIIGWFYSMARSALPQLDGTLGVSGLGAPVTVTRDAHGVPTIAAATLEDLFFAQGYVTAQDRLWQMDILRRFAAGDLAEIIGPDLIDHDRQQRILGLRVAARKAVEVASTEDRLYFAAYAKGVNAYLQSHRTRLPLEFRILGYSPRPWMPEDSMLVAVQMVEDLSASPRAALTREKILAQLGPELTADLYVNSSWHDRPPTVMPPGADQGTGDDGDSPVADSFARERNAPFPVPETLLDSPPVDRLE